MSASQTITITARVADMRSIIVNDKGQMTTVFSNTDKPVTPKVYVGSTVGRQVALTPALQRQYDSIIAQHEQLVGVEIPVAVPIANPEQAHNLLFGVVSSVLRQNFIKF